MSNAPPIAFVWQGDSFTPVSSHAQRQADKFFTIGEHYLLTEYNERSTNSHRHYFAELHDAWMNLPDGLAAEYPTVEKLRKVALIRTGWCNSQTLVCRSSAEAERFAKFMRPVDEWAIMEVRGATLTRYTAKSQSERAMGKADFQASKTAVLDYVASLLGTTRKALVENAATVS